MMVVDVDSVVNHNAWMIIRVSMSLHILFAIGEEFLLGWYYCYHFVQRDLYRFWKLLCT